MNSHMNSRIHFSAFRGFLKAFSIITAITTLLSTNLQADGTILSNKTCIRENKNTGECMGYKLPYEQGKHSILQYMKEIRHSLSPTEKKEIKTLIKYYRDQWASGVHNSISEEVFFPTRSRKYDNIYDKKRLRYARFHIYATMTLLTKEQSLTQRLRISPPELQELIHQLFCLANDIHLEEPPNFQKLINNSHVSIMTGKMQGIYVNPGIHDKETLDSATLAGLIRNLESILGFYSQWPSLSATDWIIERVPEMEKKPVIELGAGSGYQSFLFSLKGIEAYASDINPPSLTYHPIETLSAENAINKYYYMPAVVFIQDPGWNVIPDFQSLKQMPLVSTIAVMTYKHLLFKPVIFDAFDVSTYPIQDKPTTSITNSGDIYLMVFRKKDQIPSISMTDKREATPSTQIITPTPGLTPKHQEL